MRRRGEEWRHWALTPSENWNRENPSEYEFIGIQRRQPEDLQCESEKLTRLQRNPDNSKLCPSCRSFIIRSTTLENMPDLRRPCPCTKCNGALVAARTLRRHASRVPPTALPLFSAWSQHLAGATMTQSSGSSDSDVDGVGHSHGSSQHDTEHSRPLKRFQSSTVCSSPTARFLAILVPYPHHPCMHVSSHKNDPHMIFLSYCLST